MRLLSESESQSSISRMLRMTLSSSRPPNEDREAMNNPDRAGIGISDPREGSDKLLSAGSRPHPGQVGQGGEDHHRADGHVKSLCYFQEAVCEFNK